MDINATIIGQFVTFAILVWFTMKYVWPPIMQAVHAREKKIASGLEAGERGRRELELAEHKAASIIGDAKQQASQIIEQANLHSAKLVEEAKVLAKQENQRIVGMAQNEIEREVMQAKEALKNQLSKLAIAGAEKIIQRELNPTLHQELLQQLSAEI